MDCGSTTEKAVGSAILPLLFVMLCWINGLAAWRVKQNCLLLKFPKLLLLCCAAGSGTAAKDQTGRGAWHPLPCTAPGGVQL
jgi:hypothetical protein